MDKTSPREVLLSYGKWIGATEFANLISKKKQISERQAKTLITKAYRKNEVKKHVFSDRRVIYGLTEFGPPTSNLSQGYSGPINGWTPPPDFVFSPKIEEVWEREKIEAYKIDNFPSQFPKVPFSWCNRSKYYQLNVKLKVQVFLGGHFLAIIDDSKGYYKAQTDIIVEPTHGLIDGCFTLPSACEGSKQETTIEVQARILDNNDLSKKEYRIVKSWSYNPKTKDWFFEPRSFSKMSNSCEGNSWDILTKRFSSIGAYPIEIKIQKVSLRDQTSTAEDKVKKNSEETIQGIMMLKGAKTMQKVIKMNVPNEYEALLFTKANIRINDKIAWKGNNYTVNEIDEIYDIYDLSHRVAKLVKSFEPWVIGLNW